MKDGIYITQSQYIREKLKVFGMEDSRPVRTPMSTRHKLCKNDDSKEVNQTTYRSMIGKIHYVVHTSLDIALAVGIVARFLANPRENHFMDIKRILDISKALKTIDCGIRNEVVLIRRLLLMLIGQEALMIEREPVVKLSILERG